MHLWQWLTSYLVGAAQYLVAITVTYVPYICGELPCNLLLKKLGPQRMIPTMVLLWGITCCEPSEFRWYMHTLKQFISLVFTGFVNNYSGLLAARFFLGLLESGVFPSLVLYLSMFYRRRELQTRISLFFAAASLSGAFSGLLAAAIVNLDGVAGKEGWRYESDNHAALWCATDHIVRTDGFSF